MLPIQVALVRSNDSKVDMAELLDVAATLQMQLTRDFEPFWKIPATISAFTSLERVPPAWLPLAIVPPGTLGSTGDHGFHTTEKGTPIALVEATAGWSRAASHELLEMVCDPQGKRKVIGASLADLYTNNVAAGDRKHLPQGQVAYLLEICDPCQDASYSLNGLAVSDFVLPDYYAPWPKGPGRYSFTGEIKGPLELLDGGYVTWYTSIKESPVWQAKKDKNGDLTIGPMTIPAPGSSRSDVDFTNEAFNSLALPTPSGAPGALVPPSPAAAAKAQSVQAWYGKELSADLKRVLADVSTAPTAVNLDDVLSILNDLVNTPGYYEKFFAEDPTFRSGLLSKLGVNVTYPHEKPTKEQLKAVLDKIQHQQGAKKQVSRKLAALMVQGQT